MSVRQIALLQGLIFFICDLVANDYDAIAVDRPGYGYRGWSAKRVVLQ